MVLFLMPCILANDETVINQPTTLWADILDGTTYYSSTSANITIYNAQTQTVVNNVAMTNLATGRYYYNFTPNTTGIFYTYTTFYNSTGLVATATSTFYVQENNDMLLAIVLGLIAIIIYFIYLGKDLMKQPTALDENKGIQKWLSAQTVGVFTYMMASWLVLGLIFVLRQLSQGQTTQTFFETLFNVFVLVIPLINVGYWIFFVIFKVVSSLKAGIRHRK